MRKEKKAEVPEDEGEGVPLWYISFADMATLLLAFFVMLTTFASFDSASVKKINGVFTSMSSYTIFPTANAKDSMAPPPGRANTSENGSEKTTGCEADQVANPQVIPFIAQSEAFKDRKVLYIPCGNLFWAGGATLQPQGQQSLLTLADFLRQMPCQVIIGETGLGSGDEDARLKRAVAVLDFLVNNGKLLSLQCGLSNSDCSLSTRSLDQPMIQIVLLSKDICH